MADSDERFRAGCFVVLALIVVSAIGVWLILHLNQIAAGVAYAPLFVTATALDPEHAVGMLGNLTMDAYLRAAFRYWPIPLFLTTLLVGFFCWPRVLPGAVAAAGAGR